MSRFREFAGKFGFGTQSQPDSKKPLRISIDEDDDLDPAEISGRQMTDAEKRQEKEARDFSEYLAASNIVVGSIVEVSGTPYFYERGALEALRQKENVPVEKRGKDTHPNVYEGQKGARTIEKKAPLLCRVVKIVLRPDESRTVLSCPAIDLIVEDSQEGVYINYALLEHKEAFLKKAK